MKYLRVIALLMLVAAAAACSGGGGGSGGLCTVKANDPHQSTHEPDTINVIGRMDCTYSPSGLDMEIQLQRWDGSKWSIPSQDWSYKNTYSTSISMNKYSNCVNGKWRALVRGKASGPNGEAPKWSSWSVSNERTITTCGSSAALVSGSTDEAIQILGGSAFVVKNAAGDPTWTFNVGGGENPPTLGYTVDAEGQAWIDPSTFVAPQQQVCWDADDDGDNECLGVTMRGVGGPQAATFDYDTGVVSAPFSAIVDIDSIGTDFPGLGASCHLGSVSGTLNATDLDAISGGATPSAAGLPLASVTDCGTENDLINNTLGLPGTVDVSLNIVSP